MFTADVKQRNNNLKDAREKLVEGSVAISLLMVRIHVITLYGFVTQYDSGWPPLNH